MVEETDSNKSIIKKVKVKKKGSVGLTDVNEIQYKELQKLWTILQKAKKE
tara:strand:- start:91 stop:240 length:150 start_codon:yes stop_codon:yes gene_type:complete